jgi:hypothetical protein
MTTIVWPETASKVNAIRDAIGRMITIYVTVSGIPCSICNLEPVTNESTDPFCPVCNGYYWLTTISGYPILAHVTHLDTDQPNWTVGGTIFQGGSRIQLEYTMATLSAVDNAAYFMVDDRKFLEKNRALRGVPDINRIVITLKEQD